MPYLPQKTGYQEQDLQMWLEHGQGEEIQAGKALDSVSVTRWQAEKRILGKVQRPE
jgi:hypothetical protein